MYSCVDFHAFSTVLVLDRQTEHWAAVLPDHDTELNENVCLSYRGEPLKQ